MSLPQRVVAAAISVLLVIPLAAQNYPYPASTSEPPVLCTGCLGQNEHGQLNDGLPTWPYEPPLARHVGRFVDSSETSWYSVGLRTVRARMVRLSPNQERIYIGLGELIGAYPASEFFEDRLGSPPETVTQIGTQPRPSRGGHPFEKATIPDSFIYPEHSGSGWTTIFADGAQLLKDFDVDDRGYVYSSYNECGWGISHDDGRTNRTHLPKIYQSGLGSFSSIFTFKTASKYFVLVSDNSSYRILDVTNPGSPTLIRSENRRLVAWSKNETAGRVAIATSDRYVRVYTNDSLADGEAPLFEHIYTSSLLELSFDDDGAVWVIERWSELISRIAPTESGYSRTTFDVYGSTFQPFLIHAADGLIAVVGTENSRSGFRLFEKTSSGLEPVPAPFIRNYYHAAPSGYAEPPWWYVYPRNVRFVRYDGKTFLMYSADGLGDVFEIGNALIGEPRVISLSPASGPPAGGTTVGITGAHLSAPISVTFGGVAATTTFVNPTYVTAVSPKHPPGTVDVVVTTGGETIAAPQNFEYILSAPVTLNAAATTTSSITLTVASVAGATHYQFFRRNSDGSYSSIGTSASTTFQDTGRTAATAYMYRARAIDGDGNVSAFSPTDVATTVIFTDSMMAGVPIKAIHLTELRTAVNGVRSLAGLAPFNFTATVAPGQVIKGSPVGQLRQAVIEARTSLGLSSIVFSGAVTPGGVASATHLAQIRTAVQ